MARPWLLVLLLSCVGRAEPAKPVDPYAEPPAPSAAGKTATPADKVLRKVNLFRASSGLPPVVVDPVLSQGCMEHAQYMKLNRNTEAMVGLNAHQQRPGLPGASAAGAACGKAADLFPGVSDVEVAVGAWM